MLVMFGASDSVVERLKTSPGGAAAAWQDALDGYTTISQRLDPDQFSQDPEERLAAVRKWAMSLTISRATKAQLRGRGEVGPKLLPAMMNLPEVMAARPLRLPTEVYKSKNSAVELEESFFEDVSRSYFDSSSCDFGAANTSSFRFQESSWTPKVSQLGEPPWPRKQVPNIDMGLTSPVAGMAASHAAQTWAGRFADATAIAQHDRAFQRSARFSPTCAGRIDSTRPAATLVRHKLQGQKTKFFVGLDPMAGSLFSRDAVLDDELKRRGIYEAQLRKQPVTAR